jgi:hypothetical protein
VNIYRQRFAVSCPVNGESVHYRLAIETTRKIMVEDIQKALAEVEGKAAFHEDIADALFAKLGGFRQTLTAHHHGTDIETVRP